MTPSPSSFMPDAITWRDTMYRILLPAHATGGRQSIVDSVTDPGGGPPRHVLHDADESFVLLSGDVDFWLNGTRFAKAPGQIVFVPKGTEHTFQVVGSRPARMLTILTPGGCEGFFAEMAAGAFRIPQDMTQIVTIAARYHLSFTGPTLAVN